MSEQIIESREKFNKIDRKIPVLKASREFRNAQTIQQSILIGLLNKYCTITIGQPAKKSTVTQQFMRIISLDFGGNDIILMDDFLKGRCLEQMNQDISDGVSQKTAWRRYQNNKKIEEIHLLMDILTEYGYYFTAHPMKGKSETKKLDIIHSIHKENFDFSLNFLLNEGERINNLICSLLQTKDKSIVIRTNQLSTRF
ncbi:hypothetical protein EHI8A_076270 [Entamoeba histolytica HM-1:IMSS-B]|uniref:Uncharacterized protein n=6 Tax=Entamoeba histolytica TaxID=5759 RepID=C4LYR3_ENTH1|nr:hypothetical protein EHI_004520 [Entamoeba histolytica HM-1:IMSS]EMD45803.1 Hypothetical protein EHI5A_080110 [Entamoeba histolytica KU27]EMH72275.1 hypothetical protein EHI8A_076270 [Entamoeba histolytica HM-1:IMSS-B]EMS13722.1 hypothetical protein KM1_097460 [Entamoeba histolytica HM-3:IMSS]ENY61513.1 hypothetical protein EHI7A_073560 [Entamoeba histolytica HM-1:IMSS-A]GAT93974.1 hypothetical protein CL6EHI_004520 [Entamoeba histolytica]|eukprot:XP_656723.1 hypothetical protein EHI_004520 [Entamoeba histolytica HM-1:IMSS]